jgi:hypothetical protein
MSMDVITVEMIREAIDLLYRIGGNLSGADERRHIAVAIGTLEAEVANCEELERFTNEQIKAVEACNPESETEALLRLEKLSVEH